MENSPFRAQSGDRKPQTYTPVNLKLVFDMVKAGEPFKLNNEPIDVIELVCRVSGYRESQNTISLDLQDDNGAIKGVIYRKGDGSLPKALRNYTFSANGYAHIIGNLRKFNDNVQVVIQQIENITNYESVHYHKCKVLWSFLIRNGSLHVPTQPSQQSQNILTESSKKFVSPENTESNEMSYLTLEQREIMKAVGTASREKGGIARYAIAGIVGSKVKDIDRVLSELFNYGYISQTDDGAYFIVNNS
ncbi:unnamed protein product [Blepharisma stoltei]|uniref:Replication protein A C-terminal domain-containing protein n=1 Tax=Blepharisma stoltei TaxID=1481888 RepID=A0AAU9IG34_9CILI|nr:unnamed protein product [Blepharisma stoltei]